jgi:probable lipoprotein NlpC
MAKSHVIIFCLAGFLIRGPALFADPPLDARTVAARLGGNSAAAAQEARNRLLAAADAYRGVPYRHGGIDKKGLDCSGLIYASFQDSLSVSVPRTSSALYNWAEKIGEGALQPGDLVFFVTTGSGISHAGIYVGEGRFIHSASDGPKTGVIYSSMDESYWRRTFAGAGRALPALPLTEMGPSRPTETVPKEKERGKGFLVGFALAPSWSGFMKGDNPIRGLTAQGRFAWKVVVFGQPLTPGIEIRPEWDGALGVFRVPLTLSLGFNDKLRIFAGPAFSLGVPVLRRESGNRRYTGGNSWLGSAGITAVPLSFPLGRGSLDLYGELAWQSYRHAPETEPDLGADMSAGLKFSTGLRYTWEL